MALPKTPDLARPGRFVWFALAVGVVVCTMLLVHLAPQVGANLGDTDDATRLVLVRELLHGKGWWDQLFTRFQPPQGVWMHWSRLLDGGLALMDRGFGLFVSPARAEWLTRVSWPMLWVIAAVVAVMAGARRLAGAGALGVAVRPGAVIAAAVVCLFDLTLYYGQFHPGRIDHHDAQIVCALVAALGAMQTAPGVRGAILSAAATALGVAIGLEALAFEAVVAVSIGLRFLADRAEARRAQAYGATLALATAALFLIQTPPMRWTAVACDALAWNLLAGVVAGGGVLAAAAWAMRGRGWPWRLLALAAAGGAALAAYVALDPHCLRGPFADVDPRIRPFWLDHVQEMKTWPQVWKTSRPDAIEISVFSGFGVLAWLGIGFARERRRDPAWLLSGAMLALGIVFAWSAWRARPYAEFFSVAPIAVAASEAGRRLLPRRGGVVTLLIVAVLACPILSTGAVIEASNALVDMHKPAPHPGRATPAARPAGKAAPRSHGGDGDRCFDAASYAVLAKSAPGVVVSEVDLGPFIVAYTPSSAMSAPYHRMSGGLLAARGVVTAPVGQAEARARALNAAYVLECRAHSRHADRAGLAPDALQRRLDAGQPPAWLEPLSPPDAPLQLYRLRSPGPAR